MKIKTIMFVVMFVTLLTYQPKVLVAEDVISQKTIDQHIERIFGTKATIAKAVLMHESNNELDAINYNCRYNGKSTFCRKGDESKAWSVDCGIGQVNIKGKECPKELLTLNGNMELVEKIYKEQGLNAWVSYKNGAYKKFL